MPEIQSLIEHRRLRLITFANELLYRICDNVNSIPYGMRWICKKIKELAIENFPEARHRIVCITVSLKGFQADKRKIGSLIGGYIYLRFFNPVIVTPDVFSLDI